MRKTALVLAALMAPATAFAESAQSGVWTYSFEPSSGGKGGLVTALAPAPSRSGDPNDPGYVITRCMNGRTEMLVGGAGSWGLPRRKVEVVTQVDGRPAETAQWDVSSNGKAVFLDDKVEDFLRSLPENGKLRIAIKDMTGTMREAIFATEGFGPVRARIAEACGWTP